MANILVGGVNLKTLGMHGGVANIKDYGGLANDTYDNYGITQALVDAWEALDGGKIVFPPSAEGSRYRFTQGVVNDSPKVVSFDGVAKGADVNSPSTVLWLDSDADDAFLIKYASVGSPQAGGMIIERLLFEGNGDTDGLGVNQSGILFAGRCNDHQIRDCGFHFFSGYAIAHDPTVAASYNQNSSIRNTHFWAVGGCFGPTSEYADGALYLFNTLYTLDNVGLDSAVLWPSSGHTPKPYLWDLRATRDVVSLGHLLIEGVGAAGQTACIALASGGTYVFDNIWYEITTDDPTYLFAFYGTAGNKFNSSGEKIVKIGKCGGLPIWFEDAVSNETVVHIQDWLDYDADTIAEIAVWENGIEENSSGYVEIDRLQTKTFYVADQHYAGRFKMNAAFADTQVRLPIPVLGQARKLFSWNPTQGTPFRDWGEGTLQHVDGTWSIENDGDFICLNLLGPNSGSKYPRIIWRFGQTIGAYGQAENYVGSVISLAVLYRVTIDPADSPKTGGITFNSPTGFDADEIHVGDRYVNETEYKIATLYSVIGPYSTNDVYDLHTVAIGGNLTVQANLRILCFEAWLGIPEKFELEIASRINAANGLPTFAASDTTPSVGGSKIWKTNTGGLTITDLDDFQTGDEVTIISKGAIVFDTTGTNLVGSTVDLTTASGDITRWVSEDGTTKRLIAFVDVSVDNSGGA